MDTKRLFIIIAFILGLGWMEALSGQSTNCPFSFYVDGQQIRGSFTVSAKKVNAKLQIYLTDLDFQSGEAKERFRVRAKVDGLKITNASLSTDFTQRVFNSDQPLELEYDIQDPGKDINIKIIPKSFEIKENGTSNNYDITEGAIRAITLQGTTTTLIAPVTAVPPVADNTVNPTPGNNPPSSGSERRSKPQNETPKADPEEVAFERAKAIANPDDRSDAMLSFLARYNTSSRFAVQAVDFIKPEKKFRRVGDVFYYTISYASKPEIIADTALVTVAEPLHSGKHPFEYEVALLLKPATSAYTAVIHDAGKEAGFAQIKLLLERSLAEFNAQLEKISPEEYRLRIYGGDTTTFWVYFYDENGKVNILDRTLEGQNPSTELKVSELRSKWGKSGKLQIRILQKRSEITQTLDTLLEVPPAAPVWPYVLGGLALIAVVAFILRMRQARARQEMERKLQKKREEKGPNAAEEPLPEPPPPTVAEPTPAVSSGKFTIRAVTSNKEKDGKSLEESVFESALHQDNCLAIALTELWSDTAISEIQMTKKSIRGIDQFLRHQRNQFVEETEGALPEIGGFLLGRYTISPGTQRYRVLLEAFVPIIPEENNAYALEFSTESLVRELGDAQEQYPDLELVGWFHTHPGHGLFLSKPDLTIHEGFFREKYQFAMEIDTLTENLDTGFFTRKTSGSMNNTDSRLPGSKWFDWTEIEKMTRKK